MSYYHNKIISGNFEDVIKKVTELLKEQGFGVLTEIDIQQTLKKKLDVNFKKYKILGACNPAFAYKALQAEDKIGTMLPCNIIVQEIDTNKIEIAAINPLVSMQSVKNNQLENIAQEVSEKLKSVIKNL
ncbi:DUF302 domain-containing protein [Polaribacter sp. Hel1_85]|uniref:DUF302 domain-containing protein n=1 Tax=Polaribacter sp. Hel1_85 TaxID=1250005 RepID=UPI00052D5CBD|nr:DUF302 domain-containing protein [Polaribacter sp. Hel1_85]KGL62494.1 hypothetical protein PHEL85_2288 [Polaribacter sp. Hel1_85]